MSAKKVTYFSSGAQCAGQAMNTAPALPPARSIAGYGQMKTMDGVVGPKFGSGPSGFSSANQGGPTFSGSGGPTHSGSPPVGGASEPKYGPGPSGTGDTGSRYPR